MLLLFNILSIYSTNINKQIGVIKPLIDIWVDIYNTFEIDNIMDFLSTRQFLLENNKKYPFKNNTKILRNHLSIFATKFITEDRFNQMPLFFALMLHNSFSLTVNDCIEDPSIIQDEWNYCKFLDYWKTKWYHKNSKSDYSKKSVDIFFKLIKNREFLTDYEQTVILLENTYPLTYSKEDAFIQRLYYESGEKKYEENFHIRPDDELNNFINSSIGYSNNLIRFKNIQNLFYKLYEEYRSTEIKGGFYDYLIKRLRKNQFNRIKKILDIYYTKLEELPNIKLIFSH